MHFLKEYKLFALAAIATVIGLGMETAGLHLAAHWLLGIVALVEVGPLLWGMIEDLRSGAYGVDILAATAIFTSVVMRQYWAAMVIVLMLTGGESLEDYAGHRARRELDALLTRAPQKAHVLRGRKELDVPVKAVVVGDKLVIRPGEVVPVDATVLEGESSFDESSLTGESLPQLKGPHASLLSGSVNIEGVVTVKALRVAADSQYEQIIKLVRIASNSQAPFVRLADRYAVPFTIIAFAIAGTTWALSGQAIRFLEVLVVATPCPLILAAPIAVISGMSRSAKHGIIIKTGSALEKLAQAKTFAFDKTGTLTRGELKVDSVTVFGSHTKSEVAGLAAGLEQNSNHVLARAIITHATEQKYKIVKAKNVREMAGHGLQATVGRHSVLIGRARLLADQRVALPKTFRAADVQQTAAFVAIDGALAGVITFTDELRAEAPSTLAQLHALGIEQFMMVTGDNQVTAAAVAKKLNISEVVAEALPGDKLRAVEQATARPVAFVGDGVNDAPVLTASDIGIALGARGSTAASESADVVIMADDLSYVAVGLNIAERTFFIARQSILVGIGLSIALMAIFATGKFQPIYGAAIQELVDVVVIFNALRAHNSRLTPVKTPE